MTTSSTKVDWHLRGDWFDVCSCKLPCPCSFAQEPTHGDCLFTLVWHIREGQVGDVDLSGLSVVSLGEFAGNMWIGDPNAMMKLMFYIDEKGDADQRDALERIFTGKEGGWPAEFASLIEELRGIEHAPITFDAADDLAYWRAEIPGKVDLQVEALTGPTSDPSRRVTTTNAPGAEVGPGQVATWEWSSRTMRLASTGHTSTMAAQVSTSPSTGARRRKRPNPANRPTKRIGRHATATPSRCAGSGHR